MDLLLHTNFATTTTKNPRRSEPCQAGRLGLSSRKGCELITGSSRGYASSVAWRKHVEAGLGWWAALDEVFLKNIYHVGIGVWSATLVQPVSSLATHTTHTQHTHSHKRPGDNRWDGRCGCCLLTRTRWRHACATPRASRALPVTWCPGKHRERGGRREYELFGGQVLPVGRGNGMLTTDARGERDEPTRRRGEARGTPTGPRTPHGRGGAGQAGTADLQPVPACLACRLDYLASATGDLLRSSPGPGQGCGVLCVRPGQTSLDYFPMRHS